MAVGSWWTPTLVFSLFIMISAIASAVDLKTFWKRIKKPKGILIGLFCQYGLLPLLSWGLAKAFKLDYESSIALIITATCPGGILSNFFAFLIGADLPLSIAMTTASSLLSFAFIPLNSYLYIELALDEGSIDMAWSGLLISVAVLLVGIIVGMFIAWKKIRLLQKFLGIFAGVCLAYLVIVSLYDNLTSDYPLNVIGWKYFIAPLVLTSAGWILGLSFALLARLPKSSAVAVGIETSNQSTGLAIAILALSLGDDTDVYDRVVAIPAIYTLLTWGVNLVMIMIFYPLGWVDEKTDDTITCCTLIRNYRNKSKGTVSVYADDDVEIFNGKKNGYGGNIAGKTAKVEFVAESESESNEKQVFEL